MLFSTYKVNKGVNEAFIYKWTMRDECKHVVPWKKNILFVLEGLMWVCNSKLLLTEHVDLYSVKSLPFLVMIYLGMCFTIFLLKKVYITLIRNFRVSPLTATIMFFFLLFMTIAVFIFESTYSTAQSARGSSDGIRFQRVLALSNVKAPRFSFTRTSDYYFKIILHKVGENRLHTDVTNTI